MREATYPPLWVFGCTPAMGIAFGHSHPEPVTRGWRAGTVRLGLRRLRVCVLHPNRATAPDPHLKTPPEAPLVSQGRNII